MAFFTGLNRLISNRFFHHLIFWTVIYAALLFLNLSETFRMISFRQLFILFMLLPLPVYLHFFFLEKFFKRKKYPLYIMLTLLLIIASAPFFRSLFTVKMQASNGIIPFIMHMTVFLILTTSLKFLKSNFRQRILQQQNQVNRLQTELEKVKAGLNTGFMMRVLKQLHHLSLKKSERISELILQFSGMLRYTMKHSGNDRVELGEEIHIIKEYLTLEQYISGYRISTRIQGDMKKKIIPLTLVLLTEKILTSITPDSGKSVSGEINCISDDNGILFSAKITIKNGFLTRSFEPGEIEKKFRMLYGNYFKLAHREDEHFRSVSIHILGEPPVQIQRPKARIK